MCICRNFNNIFFTPQQHFFIKNMVKRRHRSFFKQTTSLPKTYAAIWLTRKSSHFAIRELKPRSFQASSTSWLCGPKLLANLCKCVFVCESSWMNVAVEGKKIKQVSVVNITRKVLRKLRLLTLCLL